MSDSAPREWRFYIDDMIAFAENVIAYTDGLDQERFVASGLNYDATVRNLELIGEAATYVPDAVRAAHPQVPCRLIIATRNRLIRGYRHRQQHHVGHRRLGHSSLIGQPSWSQGRFGLR